MKVVIHGEVEHAGYPVTITVEGEATTPAKYLTDLYRTIVKALADARLYGEAV
jgi:hypothetical protein